MASLCTRALAIRRSLQSRLFSATAPTTSDAQPPLADVDFKLDDLVEDLGRTVNVTSNKGLSFATMLRRSKFMQLGDFEGRLVVGKVERRVVDDLYIDFGLKFNAVCKVPVVNSELYVRGSRVLLRLHDPELSERFLGSKQDLTLLEADATLMRLLYSPAGRQSKPDASNTKSTPPPVDQPPSV